MENKKATKIFALFIVSALMLTLSVPFVFSQSSGLIWDDRCDSGDVLGVPFRTAKRLEPHQYGINSSVVEGMGNTMYVNTLDVLDGNAQVAYGIMGAEALGFGKTFDSVIRGKEGQEMWVSFVFFVNAIPTSTTQPKMNIFSLSTASWNYGEGFGDYCKGWILTFSVYTSSFGGNSKGDLVVDAQYGYGSAPNVWGTAIYNYRITNVNFELPHRVALKFNYETNISSDVFLEEIYVDDSPASTLDKQINAAISGTGLRYYAGSGFENTYRYYNVDKWYETGFSYGAWMIDDVQSWLGDTYYEYGWGDEAIPPTDSSSLLGWLLNLLRDNWILVIIIVCLIVYILLRN